MYDLNSSRAERCSTEQVFVRIAYYSTAPAGSLPAVAATFEDGYRVAEIIEALRESSRTARDVRLQLQS